MRIFRRSQSANFRAHLGLCKTFGSPLSLRFLGRFPVSANARVVPWPEPVPDQLTGFVDLGQHVTSSTLTFRGDVKIPRFSSIRRPRPRRIIDLSLRLAGLNSVENDEGTFLGWITLISMVG